MSTGPYKAGDAIKVQMTCAASMTAVALGNWMRNGTADNSAITLTVGTLPATDVQLSFTIPSGYSAGDQVSLSVDRTTASGTVRVVVWSARLVQWSPTTLPATGTLAVKPAVTLAAGDVSGNLPVDLQTIKTQAVTAAAAVTFPASIGTSTYSGVSQTGDSYAIVNSATYGNAHLAKPSDVSVTVTPTINPTVLSSDSVAAIRAGITGGAYALQTDGSGYLKLSTGTGTGQLNIVNGIVSGDIRLVLGSVPQVFQSVPAPLNDAGTAIRAVAVDDSALATEANATTNKQAILTAIGSGGGGGTQAPDVSAELSDITGV